MLQTKHAQEAAQERTERCESTTGGPLAPVGFGVRCEKPAGHSGLHKGGGGAWIDKKDFAMRFFGFCK
jgi:hypothetical protein